MDLSDLARATDEQRSLILAQAERRLEYQNDYAAAADQRAATVTGAATALAAAAAAIAADSLKDGQITPLTLAAFAAAAAFSRATWFAMRCLGPDHFDSPGYRPVDFLYDVRQSRSREEMEIQMIEHAQSMLTDNHTRLEARASHIREALRWMLRAPVGAAIGAFVFLFGNWAFRLF